MRVRKINMVLKLVIHVTNRLKIYFDTVRIIKSELFFPWKRVFMEYLDFIIWKKKTTRSIFWGFRIINSELVKNTFFYPITKEKLDSNSKIWKPHGHFCKKLKAREKVMGRESKFLKIIEEINLSFFSQV